VDALSCNRPPLTELSVVEAPLVITALAAPRILKTDGPDVHPTMTGVWGYMGRPRTPVIVFHARPTNVSHNVEGRFIRPKSTPSSRSVGSLF